MRQRFLAVFALLVGSSMVAACGGLESKPIPLSQPPSYTSQVPASQASSNGATEGGGRTTMDSAGGAVPSAVPTTGKGAAATPTVPGGRVADVQEADVYRIQSNKLYLLNTYRGFLVYDITDTKNPVRISRLPVYGYPVEMFVENNTVYALLSDALTLTQSNGQLAFERRNTSQIVTIDVSDPANPRLLQAQDIAGQLREGVSRKIENTIYVVSYQPTGYWWYGWGHRMGSSPTRQPGSTPTTCRRPRT